MDKHVIELVEYIKCKREQGIIMYNVLLVKLR